MLLLLDLLVGTLRPHRPVIPCADHDAPPPRSSDVNAFPCRAVIRGADHDAAAPQSCGVNALRPPAVIRRVDHGISPSQSSHVPALRQGFVPPQPSVPFQAVIPSQAAAASHPVHGIFPSQSCDVNVLPPQPTVPSQPTVRPQHQPQPTVLLQHGPTVPSQAAVSQPIVHGIFSPHSCAVNVLPQPTVPFQAVVLPIDHSVVHPQQSDNGLVLQATGFIHSSVPRSCNSTRK